MLCNFLLMNLDYDHDLLFFKSEKEKKRTLFLSLARCFKSLKRNEDPHHLQVSFPHGLEFVS